MKTGKYKISRFPESTTFQTVFSCVNTSFTILDIRGVFHQLFMHKKSRDYTAFSVGNFQYRWVRMPIGLASAPLICQRTINELFEEYIDKNVHVYLDDVVVYAKTKEKT